MPYKDKRVQRRAQAAWYQKNKDDIKRRRRASKQEARQWVNTYKTQNPVCTDCQIAYPPHVLDFDHIKDKSFGISRALQMGTSLEKIKQEIKKCEIVCSNCHRIRTYERLQGS
jgi:hypothetical protein